MVYIFWWKLRGHFEQVHVLCGVTFDHVLVIVGKEIAHVIILFRGETVSQSHQFENLTTGTTSLQWPVS